MIGYFEGKNCSQPSNSRIFAPFSPSVFYLCSVDNKNSGFFFGGLADKIGCSLNVSCLSITFCEYDLSEQEKLYHKKLKTPKLRKTLNLLDRLCFTHIFKCLRK